MRSAFCMHTPRAHTHSRPCHAAPELLTGSFFDGVPGLLTPLTAPTLRGIRGCGGDTRVMQLLRVSLCTLVLFHTLSFHTHSTVAHAH